MILLTSQVGFSLSGEEIAFLISALNLFISNDIEEMSFEIKQSQNALANITGKKLSNHETQFNLEDLKIMAVALFYFQDIIEETGLTSIEFATDKDTEKYLSIISDLLDKIEILLNANGHSLYPDN